MSGIFISYRRNDAEGDAGRLFDDLQRRCPRNRVFWDADIPAGPDYREVLVRKLEACDILLALIGPQWLEIKDPKDPIRGKRRLDFEDDPVRMEITRALAKQKMIIPVLLRGAGMPDREVLPEAMQQLAFCNKRSLRHDRWKDDVNELVKHFPKHLSCAQELSRNLSWKFWAHLILLPIVLLVATHMSVIYLEIHFLYFSTTLSLLLGAMHAFQFRFLLSEKIFIAGIVSFTTGIAVSILVSLLWGESIVPNGAAIKLLARLVASILLGYLSGTAIVDVMTSRGMNKGEHSS